MFLGDPSAGGNSGAVQGLMGNANGDLTDDTSREFVGKLVEALVKKAGA